MSPASLETSSPRSRRPRDELADVLRPPQPSPDLRQSRVPEAPNQGERRHAAGLGVPGGDIQRLVDFEVYERAERPFVPPIFCGQNEIRDGGLCGGTKQAERLRRSATNLFVARVGQEAAQAGNSGGAAHACHSSG